MLSNHQIEIGVNKFKNGNAQFYHKLGIAPQPDTKAETEKKGKFTGKCITLHYLFSM